MELDRERAWGRSVTGMVLVVLGGIFLLMNFGMWHYGSVREWWPAIFFVIAFGQLLAPTPRRVGSAVFMTALGLWFFGCMHEWHGMTYVNSWPVLLVAGGLDMVLSGVLAHLTRRDERIGGGGSDHV